MSGCTNVIAAWSASTSEATSSPAAATAAALSSPASSATSDSPAASPSTAVARATAAASALKWPILTSTARDAARGAAAAQGADPPQRAARPPPGRAPRDRGAVSGPGGDGLGAQRPLELAQQQRVPAGRAVTGAREGLVAADQLGGRSLAQRPR